MLVFGCPYSWSKGGGVVKLNKKKQNREFFRNSFGKKGHQLILILCENIIFSPDFQANHPPPWPFFLQSESASERSELSLITFVRSRR